MKNPMQAFVNTEFDCEFRYITFSWEVYGTLKSCDMGDDDIFAYRPRLNREQVIDLTKDRNKDILVDGFVWDVEYEQYNGYSSSDFWVEIESSKSISRLIKDDDGRFLWLAFKGVQQGYGLSEWALANSVPVYDDKMEVAV